MFSLKRKRVNSSWDDFVDELRDQIDSKYKQVNTMETSPLQVMLYLSPIARVPFTIFSYLDNPDYDGIVDLNPVTSQGKTKLTLTVKYSNNSKRSNVHATNSYVLQSPKKFMEENLKLRNGKVIASVENLIKEVQNYFRSQMDWGNAPYTIIYHKKHNQLIVRFRFITKSLQFNIMGESIVLGSSWIEYNQRKNSFFLVTILDNCV